MKQAEVEGRITGVPIASRGFKLSHLFFADDSLLFCRANFDEWRQIQQVLQVYEGASRRKLNYENTAILYSRNTRKEFRDYINFVTGVSTIKCFEKYLGLPALVGQSKLKTFAEIQGMVSKKLGGWNEKFISKPGKEVLLKVVIKAIPTYYMSVLSLPEILCRNLNSLICKFWWGAYNQDKMTSWMSLTELGRSKLEGGMGFGELKTFNLALLAKQGGKYCKIRIPWWQIF